MVQTAPKPRSGRLSGWLMLCLAGVTLGSSAAAATKAKLSSQWGTANAQMAAQTPMVPFSKDSPFTVGFSNDQQFLYVLLRTSDATTRTQVLRQGLVVWFDSQGGTKKQFGIQYPMGRRPGSGYSRQADSDYSSNPDAAWTQAASDGRLESLEVLGPGKDDRRIFAVAKLDEISAKISSVEGTVTYQLKVPLLPNGDVAYGIGSAPTGVIGVGLATPEAAANENRAAGGGMGRGGGLGGRGRRGGYGGGGMGQRSSQQSKPLKDWTTLQLASSPGK